VFFEKKPDGDGDTASLPEQAGFIIDYGGVIVRAFERV